MVYPDIAKPAVADLSKRLGDAVGEGLGTDKAVIGQEVRAPGHVLTPSETDFKMKGAVMTEQPRGGDLAVGWDGNFWKEIVEKCPLGRAQRLSLATAVEPIKGGGISFLVRAHDAAR